MWIVIAYMCLFLLVSSTCGSILFLYVLVFLIGKLKLRNIHGYKYFPLCGYMKLFKICPGEAFYDVSLSDTDMLEKSIQSKRQLQKYYSFEHTCSE